MGYFLVKCLATLVLSQVGKIQLREKEVKRLLVGDWNLKPVFQTTRQNLSGT